MNISYSETDLWHQSLHRASVFSCPHCDFKFPDKHKSGVWLWVHPKNVREVILQSRWNKTDGVIVISECPSCFELSWVHEELKNYLTDFDNNYGCFRNVRPRPKELIEALRKELKERIDKMWIEWKESLCKKCMKLNEVSFEFLYAHSDCDGRYGPVSNECDKFKQCEDDREQYACINCKNVKTIIFDRNKKRPIVKCLDKYWRGGGKALKRCKMFVKGENDETY